jgi:hypothetical protein
MAGGPLQNPLLGEELSAITKFFLNQLSLPTMQQANMNPHGLNSTMMSKVGRVLQTLAHLGD